MKLSDYYTFRNNIVNSMLLDLIGPAGGEFEIINDSPTTRYISGVLYPQGPEKIDPEQDIDQADDQDDVAAPDPPVALANRRYPSSMGMTFTVDSQTSHNITVRISAASYEPILIANDLPAARRSAVPQSWQRRPLSIAPLTIDVAVPVNDRRISLADGLELFCRVRPADPSGFVPVTLVMLNKKASENQPGVRDARSFFQPHMEVSADAPRGAFVERASPAFAGAEADIRSYRLLYRYAREFAIGHGCSVNWQTAPQNTDRAAHISIDLAPKAEVPIADSNPDISSVALGMLYLKRQPRADCIAALLEFCEGYARWIDDRRQEASGLALQLQPTATLHLDRCADALRRMRLGIEVLGQDDAAWKAFRWMNAAMLQQRARIVWLRAMKPTPEPVEDDQPAWRPFQLAFILQCLEGIARAQSPDRDLADLLWFPTGGGKTEAYLGLIAFTVFLRRLRIGNRGGGVTALMRYTLRLLTIQQFDRASLLICCCEKIRRENPELGMDPVSIGLWVGQGSTPNSRQEARTALSRLRLGAQVPEANPVQLFTCPWCGSALDYRNYWLQTNPARLIVGCRKPDCAFGQGLPLFVVDEDIYDFRPTLIIATVDKFASLPWREQAGNLFNISDGPTDARPELIIQDELHLISGPLGTLTGIYETAVDIACTQDRIRPKVIASTATIRRAEEQARGLFNREVRQFPPAGLDARDSYFAVEAPREQRGTRLFLGLSAPGTSQTTLLVRSYASLLQKAAEIPAPAEVKDPYWTLVGYFNSLRLLGGARMQVQDDVNDRMDLLATQSGLARRPLESQIVELTSREQSSKIPEHLKEMAVSLPSSDAVDVILATNMISVGVDVDRLGLMVVMGQPQSTSEYIQSTSRVGRRWPGLIVVLFNSARSRDRSHYESFLAYHSALYRQVEATSVTPFSARARDRALHAVLVALARLEVSALRPNAAAANIVRLQTDLEPIKRAILDRIEQVAPDELAGATKQVAEIFDDWISKARTRGTLQYWDKQTPDFGLLGDASVDATEQFPTLWSLRDVDQESNLRLVGLEGG